MASSVLPITFNGRWPSLFREVAVGGLLTVFTFGLYRSWMKTRLRHWYWSAVNVGGLPLDYTGHGSEKFLGFLMAIAFLAAYIAIVNPILMYASFSLLHHPAAGTTIAILGLLPVVFLAEWRARVYLYGRTRWRGIRLALDGPAWGYVWRSLVGLAAALATFGLLLPWMVFERQKYAADHAWYGTVKFEQDGHWRMLLPGVKILVPALIASAVVFAIGRLVDPVALRGLWITLPAAVAGLIHARIYFFRTLMNNRRVGRARFAVDAPSPHIVGTVSIGVAIVAAFAALASSGVSWAIDNRFYNMGITEMMAFFTDNTAQWTAILSIVLIFAVFALIWTMLNQLLVILPLLHALAQGLRLDGAEGLAHVAQRPRVAAHGADGLFEAFDMGMGL